MAEVNSACICCRRLRNARRQRNDGGARIRTALSDQQERPQSAATKDEAAKPARKKDEVESLSPFSVVVGQVYDGPLDLLLDLIRKQDIDIYDIPIAKITAQFLSYVEGLKQTDVDAAGDFIYTAALLIHIKSRMLLPRSPAETAEGERRSAARAGGAAAGARALQERGTDAATEAAD